MTKFDSKSHLIKVVVKTLICLLLGLIFLSPVILIVINAFKPTKDILLSFISFPKSFFLDNFIEAATLMNFGRAFFNTVFVSIATVLLAGFSSYFAAYGISHLRGRVSNFLYMLFVLGQIVPFQTVMIAISIMATKLHLTNTYLGLILFDGGFYIAFGVMTYVGFLKSVPKELEEAAAIDGAGALRIMMRIIYPLVKPTTVTLVILFFLWTWNDLVLPSIIISDPDMRTITVNLYMFKSATSAHWNLLIAGLTLSMIPIILIYIFGQKYITNGLTAGAVK